MLQVKTFYAAESYGAKAVKSVQEEVNAFLKELSPYNKVISIHPAMIAMPETENTMAFTSYSVLVLFEVNI